MDAASLHELITKHPRLNWLAACQGCEARADFSAELCTKNSEFEVEKIWADPPYNGHLTIYLDNAHTERVYWNYHVAVVLKTSDEESSLDTVLDPALFESPVPVSTWQQRIITDSMNGVNFSRSFRLAFHQPFSYEGDSCARDKMLKIREQELDQYADLKVFDTLQSTAKYRRARFVDALLRTDSDAGKELIYCRNHHMLFGRMWIMNWLWDEFLERLKLVEYWCGIPLGQIAAEFDLKDPMLQVNLQFRYWQHMDEIFGKVEALSQNLQNLSNTSEEALLYQDFMEMDEVQNVWFSPLGARLWAKFGFDCM